MTTNGVSSPQDVDATAAALSERKPLHALTASYIAPQEAIVLGEAVYRPQDGVLSLRLLGGPKPYKEEPDQSLLAKLNSARLSRPRRYSPRRAPRFALHAALRTIPAKAPQCGGCQSLDLAPTPGHALPALCTCTFVFPQLACGVRGSLRLCPRTSVCVSARRRIWPLARSFQQNRPSPAAGALAVCRATRRTGLCARVPLLLSLPSFLAAAGMVL